MIDYKYYKQPQINLYSYTSLTKISWNLIILDSYHLRLHIIDNMKYACNISYCKHKQHKHKVNYLLSLLTFCSIIFMLMIHATNSWSLHTAESCTMNKSCTNRSSCLKEYNKSLWENFVELCCRLCLRATIDWERKPFLSIKTWVTSFVYCWLTCLVRIL